MNNVTITGTSTHFVQGTTTADFGAGITVTSLTVNSATSASANITISPTTNTGQRDVTLTTGSEVVKLANGFTVQAGPAAISSVNSNAAQQGQNLNSVAITGTSTHFAQGTTTADFGAGITVNSLTITDATHATANITVSPTAATGARNVTLTTGGEVATLANAFAVQAGPAAIASVAPNSGQQGQMLSSVVITGAATHFAQGTTTASFGSGITVNSLTVTSATSATANVTISTTAATGTNTVTLTTGGEVAALANAFTILPGTPALTSVNPNSGQQGQTLASVAITGAFTHFASGTTASFGAGITVNSLTINSATSATANITVSPTTNTGARDVTLTTGAEVVVLAGGFTVMAGPAVIASVNPNTGTQGQHLTTVAITGTSTHFAQGTTIANFGADITVNSLTVNSATSATADITISATAATGTRNVTLTTGGEMATLSSAFTVQAGTATVTSVTPNSGQQGATVNNIAIVGAFTHFVQGTTTASFGAGITVTLLTITDATHATANVTISPTTTTGARNVSLTTGGEVATLTNGFTVQTGPAAISNVSPNSGQQGQTLANVMVTGTSANFAQGTTTANFGAGITVNSVTVNSLTSATVSITIAVSAATGVRDVTLTTGGEVATLASGFTVLPGTPVITSVNPNSGQQGQTLASVAITGAFTHFASGTTTASFGADITVNSVTVTSATNATVNLTISAIAATGPRDVTMTTGAEVVVLAGGFTITAGGAVIASVNPNTGTQGQTLTTVAITGTSTHFAQGTTTLTFTCSGCFGPGITVNSLTVTDTTHATANITISATASTGARNVTLTTGGEVATLSSAFAVQAGTAAITSVTPNSGQQGAAVNNIAIVGAFTHFVQGTTTASFGAGITVTLLTITDATHATANVTISPTTTTGARNLSLTTGGEVATLTNGFTVQTGPAAISSVSPNSGQQGQMLSVIVTGTSTNFAQGTTTATLGIGITVNSVTVNTLTSATVSITISPTTNIGARDVTLTTGGEVATLAASFTVTTGPAAITTVNPNTGHQGETVNNIAITGSSTHWVQGTTTLFFVIGITVNSLTIISPTSATASITIAPGVSTGAKNVFMTTGGENAVLAGGFTVLAGIPAITSVNPNSGAPGQTLNSVAITGQFTHWVQGTTTVSFGAGITLNSLTVNSATTATANISIMSTATAGARNVTMTTGAEVATLTNGFTVLGVATCPLPKGGQEALLSGNTFAARITGWNDNSANGPFNAVASFTTLLNGDGSGSIFSGVADFNGINQTVVNQAMTGGCFSLGSDLRGTMIWTFSTGSIVFAISVRADGHKGKMIEFDDTTPNPPFSGGRRGSGEFRRQDTTAFSASTLSGPFAFGSVGWNANTSRVGVIGAGLNFNGVNSITGGAGVVGVAGGPYFDNVGISGSFTPPDPNHGRGTMSLTITSGTLGTVVEGFSYYIEKSGQIFVQTINAPDTNGGHIAANGVGIKQSGAPFGPGSFNAPSVFAVTGFDSSHNGTHTDIGMINSSGNGLFTGILEENSDSLITLNEAISGTITLSPNGLGVVTITSPATAPTGDPWRPTSIAMAAPNTAFLLTGTQALPDNDVEVGIVQPQTIPIGGFVGGSLNGNFFFGSEEPATVNVSVESGVVTFTSPNFNGTQDQSSLTGLSSGNAISGSLTMDMSKNGRGVITPSGGGAVTILWSISTSNAVLMDTTQSVNAVTQNVTIIDIEQ